MEEAFIALLLADPATADRLGDRIWPAVALQGGAVPYAIFQRITGLRDYTSQGPSGYIQSRVQVDVYGESYAGSKLAARAIINAVSGYRDGLFKGIFVDSERDLPENNAGSVGAGRLYRTSLDFIVHHTGD